MAHIVKVDQFEGPLDLLLRLIEREELDVTTIALAHVCEQYLAHLKAVETRLPEDVADFLVIAAKLLYLKSLALIPGQSAPVEEDTTGLAEQLRLYREFVEASKEILRRYELGPVLYAAERLPVVQPSFLPPPRLTLVGLRDEFARMLAELEPIVRIPRAIIGRVISIEERVDEIQQLIAARPHASFSDVLRGRRGRQEAIVSLLAILELVKQRVVDVEQEERFAPITIARTAASTSPYGEVPTPA